MKYWTLIFSLALLSFKGADTEKQVLERLQGHKWLIKEYSANDQVVEISPSIQNM